jgi:hypothetical protein
MEARTLTTLSRQVGIAFKPFPTDFSRATTELKSGPLNVGRYRAWSCTLHPRDFSVFTLPRT